MAAVVKAKNLGPEFKNQSYLERATYDFSVDGGAVGSLDLFTATSDVVIKNVYLYVKTTCTSGGSATVSYGPTGALTAFMTTTAGAVANLTANAVLYPPATEGTPNTFAIPRRLASGSKIIMAIGTAALTAGVIEFVVEYAAA